MAALKLLGNAQEQLKRLEEALMDKAKEFDSVIKMGRTQLQDAVPIRLGQEFHAYASAIRRDIRRLDNAKEEIRCLNLGGTAIGTGLNADVQYFHRVVKNMSTLTGEELVQSYDMIDATQNLATCEKISIDYAVMEKAESIYTLPAEFGWSDLGSWGSLRTLLPQDEHGNAGVGNDISLHNCHNCIVHTAGEKQVVVEGLDGYIIAERNGALLVCSLKEEQNIKRFTLKQN